MSQSASGNSFAKSIDPELPGAVRPLPGRRERLIFALTIFLSAFLLFQVQPLLGKYVLPWFGGAPAVWTTCMLFFQALLLAGYAYAHGLRLRTEHTRQGKGHMLLLMASVALLLVLTFLWPSPITPGTNWRPAGSDRPVRDILLLLSVSAGLPYLILASTGPLLQHWFAVLWPDTSPYRLYAVSNLGSLLGLLTYPFVFEPRLTLRTQGWMWSFGYLVFVLGCGACAEIASKTTAPPDPAKTAAASRPGLGTVLLWIGLPACGSLMLLATTNLMTQDVAAVPLLWILPLSLYLLSFILCFGSGRWYQRWLFHPLLAVAVVMAVLALFRPEYQNPLPQIVILGGVLFAACMVLHGELSRRKPRPERLTAYYLAISAGGALGGAFTALLAPRLFPAYWEFHLGLWLTVALAAVALFFDRASWLHDHQPWLPPAIVLGTLAIPGVLMLAGVVSMDRTLTRRYLLALAAAAAWTIYAGLRGRPRLAARFRWVQLCVLTWLVVLGYALLALARMQPGTLVARARNFYGVLAVWEHYRGNTLAHSYEETHGRITHGIQLRTNGIDQTATGYFDVRSGVGRALLYHPRRLRAPQAGGMNIGVVGLGVGTLAVYAQPGDSIRFYEINPDVIRFADLYFSYLLHCKGSVQRVPGDGRLSLQRELEQGRRQQFDLLILDAFTGDAPPVHLLTREALSLYLQHLRPLEGVLAFDITNRALDLEPVLARLAEHFGLYAVRAHSQARGTAVLESDWVLLSYSRAILETPEIAAAARPLKDAKNFPLWTDQYSDLFSVLK